MGGKNSDPPPPPPPPPPEYARTRSESLPPPAYDESSFTPVPRDANFNSHTGYSAGSSSSSAAAAAAPNTNERTSLLGNGNGQRNPQYVYGNENTYQYTHFPRPILTQQRNRKRRTPCARILTFLAAVFLAACAVCALSYGTGNQTVHLPEPVRRVRVAVVGAGPAGVGVAYGLSSELARSGGGIRAALWGRESKVEVEVTVFEKAAAVGGRLLLHLNRTTHFGPQGLGMQDVATSALLPATSLIRTRAQHTFGERWHADPSPRTHQVAFFDGQQTLAVLPRPLSDSGWQSWKGYLALVLRYGVSVWKARGLPEGPLKGVERFLSLRGSFTSLAEMVQGAGLADLVGRTGADAVEDAGVAEKYAQEVLGPQLKRQLGQEAREVSEFALGAALERESQAGTGTAGGMEEALNMLLEHSGAKVVLRTEVAGLKRRRVDGGFGAEKWDVKLLEEDGNGKETVRYEVFDHVVVAAPLDPAFSQKLGLHADEESLSYRSVWVTMVLLEGGLDSAVFGGDAVDEILPIPRPLPSQNPIPGEDEDAESDWLDGIHEISHVRDTYGPDASSLSADSTHAEQQNTNSSIQTTYALYRILSSTPVSQETLSRLFGAATNSIVEIGGCKIERAWPLLWPRAWRELLELGGFEVAKRGVGGRGATVGMQGNAEGLWWLGGYEAVFSGVDAAWKVGEEVGKAVARRVRG